jgi:hypothetical protein
MSSKYFMFSVKEPMEKSVYVQYQKRRLYFDIIVPHHADGQNSTSRFNYLAQLHLAFQDLCTRDKYFSSKMSTHYPVFETPNEKTGVYFEMNSTTKLPPEEIPVILQLLHNSSPAKSIENNNMV